MTFLLLLPLSGCTPCGEGTTKVDGQCVPVDEDTGEGEETGGGDSGTDSPGDTHTGGDSDTAGDTHTGGDTDTEGDTSQDTAEAWDVCDDGVAPFADLQAAIDAAGSGDVIAVCPGVYDPVRITTGVDVELVGDGYETTAIAGGSGVALTVEGGTLSIRGFSLRGTGELERGGAVDQSGGTLLAEDVRIDACGGYAALWQSGGEASWDLSRFEDNDTTSILWAVTGASTLTLTRSVFQSNEAGSALFTAIDASVVRIRNVLWWDNRYSGVIVSLDGWHGGDHAVTNNVFYGNTDPDVSSAHDNYLLGAQLADFRNNIVASNPTSRDEPVQADYSLFDENGEIDFVVSGDANLFADPHFTDPEAGDFSLRAGYSPALNAGDPSSAYDDADGSRNDMGIFGGPNGSWP